MKTRVLIVDDSPLVRKIAADILESDADIEVIATASNGEIAIRKIQKQHPDVVTMDIEMPGMGGLAAIREIMIDFPTPVIVMSAFATRGAELTMQALELGAVDFISKPSSSLSGGIDDISQELIEKVKNARTVAVRKLESAAVVEPAAPERRVKSFRGVSADYEIVAVGTSTGGPVALRTLLSGLPADFPVGIVIVQHMPPVFTRAFSDRLDSLCEIKVREAADGDLIEPGLALIAPGDFHMTVSRYEGNARVLLHTWNQVSGHRPSVDVLMHSVSREYQSRAVGVIMTGMGKDGAAGLKELRAQGGYVIAQDRKTSVIYGMNREVILAGDAHEVVPLPAIAERVMDRLRAVQHVY
jgi:two-component system chemotaxis response regulator CheB